MSILKSQLSLLMRHADLLETIFKSRRLEATDESAKDLETLRMKRVLVCGSDGFYRIHSGYKKLMEMILDQRRAFDTGNPIAHEIQNLTLSASAMHEGGRAGDDIASRDHLEDGIDTILMLSVDIDDQLRIFDLSVRNGFHDARTMEERNQRNLHFQARANELSDTISTLNSDALIDLISTPYTRELRRIYDEEIRDRIDTWSIRLSGLIKDMNDFLYKSKQIEAETKRFRVMFHTLQTVPVSDQVQALEAMDCALWPSKGIAKTAYDVLAPAHEDAIDAATSKLTPASTEVDKSNTTRAGHVAKQIAYPEELDDPYDLLIDEIIELGQGSKDGISVKEWASQKGIDRPDHFVIEVFDTFLTISDGGSGVEGLQVLEFPTPNSVFTSGLTDIVLKAA